MIGCTSNVLAICRNLGFGIQGAFEAAVECEMPEARTSESRMSAWLSI